MTNTAMGNRAGAFERSARASAVLAATIGVVSLIGWTAEIEILKRIVPTFSAMKPNTAVCSMLAGAALWSALRPAVSNPIPVALSAIVITIGALTLFQYAAGVDFGIDELLFHDAAETQTPGRMAPTTAASFVLLGTAMAWLRSRVRLAHVLAALVAAFSLVPMLGYLYGVEGLHTISTYASVALPTTIAALVLSLGVLNSFPLRGLTAPLANDGAAGVMMRRAFPTAVAIPIVTGWLIVRGEDAGWWDPRFSSSLVVVATVLLIGLLLWRNAILLFGVDEARSRAVQDLRELNFKLEERVEARTYELTASEERFRSVSESATDAIITATEKGRIEFVNAAAAGLFGYTPDDLAGAPLTVLMPERFHAAHEAGIERFVETGEAKLVGQGNVELTGQRSDGTEFPLELSLSSWEEKGATFVSGVIRDITQRKKAELALRESELSSRELAQREQQLSQLKNEFVGIVAHDLKSPMTVISGFADIMLNSWDDMPDTDKIEFLGRIRDNIGRLSTLVDDVLQVSRIESGEMIVEAVPLDLARLIRRTAEEVSSTYEGREVAVTLPEDLPLVLGDEDRQWRVLSNLLSNALKFSEAPAPVEVSARVTEGDVEVTVVDAGHGIRPEDFPKLFQRFSRVQQLSGKNVKGTGLGLYITKSLVEAQGGRIWVESEPGKSTTFRYTVPVARGDG